MKRGAPFTSRKNNALASYREIKPPNNVVHARPESRLVASFPQASWGDT